MWQIFPHFHVVSSEPAPPNYHPWKWEVGKGSPNVQPCLLHVNGEGLIQIPPAVSRSFIQPESISVWLCCAASSFVMLITASVTSLCVGDKDTGRSSCSLIMKLIYQADLLLCRLCRVIQSARNLGWAGEACVLWVSQHWPEVLCMLHSLFIHYYTQYACFYVITVWRKTNQALLLSNHFHSWLKKQQQWFNNLKTNTINAQWMVMLTDCLIIECL